MAAAKTKKNSLQKKAAKKKTVKAVTKKAATKATKAKASDSTKKAAPKKTLKEKEVLQKRLVKKTALASNKKIKTDTKKVVRSERDKATSSARDKTLLSPEQDKQPVAKKGRPKKNQEESLALLTKSGKKWNTLFQKAKKQKAPIYQMTQQYEAKTPIQHSLLGWGYILSNQNDRLEVLFEDGIKTLISNLKR